MVHRARFEATARPAGWLSVALAPILLAAGPALAGGFTIREQSASSQGHAFASASTGIEDISTMFFNPSLLTFHDGNQFVAVGSYLAPQADFENGSASNALGQPIGNSAAFAGAEDSGKDALVPAGYGMISPSADLRLGLAVTAPFGVATTHAEGWVGRYHALDSRLSTLNFAPTAAYRINRYLSVGAGFIAQYADAKLSNAVDFGLIGAGMGGTPGAEDGRAKIRGDDWGFGYTLGLTVAPAEGTRIGLGYRSKVSHRLDGDAKFDLGSGVGSAVSGATGGFVDSGASASVRLPEQLSLGIHHDITDQWAVMGEVQWTHWSRFRELRIEFDNPAQADSVTDESWRNSWFFALGGSYRPTEDWTFRMGLAFDQTPVPDRTRTPRVPDEDRYWLAAGVSYQPADWLSLSLGYTHIFMPDAELDLTLEDPNHATRGALEGTYESRTDIVALQGRLRF